MGDILFLAHRIPFPPDRGDKIRSHHLLRALAKLAPVHVGCFTETAADRAAESELAQLAASYCLPQRDLSLVRAGASALLSGKPVSLTAFDSPKLHQWVRTTLAERDIDTIVIFSGQMGQYVPADFMGRVVIDLCDVDSAKFDAYATEGTWPRSWIDAREGRMLREVETALAARAAHTLLITDQEAELFRSRLPAGADADIRALGNGIDSDFFDPMAVGPHRELAGSPGPHFVFTGQMDYAPNVAACERVFDRLLPRLRETHPEAQFHVVGRAPLDKLVARAGQDGIRVWGEVPDVRPFLAAADIVLAPLTIARGVQNKVLEAMAMARPVVLSPEAATGIDAQDGAEFAVGQDDDALIAQCNALLADGPAALAMASAARRFVLDNRSWEAMLAPLAGLVGRSQKAGARDAA